MNPIDRRSSGYEPRWDIDAAVGAQGELFVHDLIRSIQNARIEVKTDEKAADTGNLYIEFECRKSGLWCPSGIAVTEADMWVQVIGNAQIAVAVPLEVLRPVARECYRLGRIRACTRGSHPTRGVAIPLKFLLDRAATTHHPEGDR